MSLYKTLLGFFAVAVVIISCKKELSNEEGNPDQEVDNQWEFKQGDSTFGGLTDTAFIQTVNTIQTISISGVQTNGSAGEITIQLAGTQIGAGAYGTEYVLFQYFQDGSLLYSSVPSQGSDFTLTITRIDSSYITGTFSGTVQDAQGNNYNIAEGKFSAPMGTSTDTEVPVESGQLTVWAKGICSDGGVIEVSVNGENGQITDGLISQPECGADGAATFNLPAGTYTVQATCSGVTLNYEVTIDKTGNYLQVDFQNPPVTESYLPLGVGSEWNYVDLSVPGNEQSITSEEEDVYIEQEGRQYTKLVSNKGEEFYYRQSGKKYFRFVTLDFQGNVSDPPSLEIVILDEDAADETPWESPVVDLSLAGMQVKAKLVSKIVNRGTADINGVSYANSINVNTELYVSFDGGATFNPSGNSYNTVYSKGKGIVYYYDINNNTEWGLTSSTIVE